MREFVITLVAGDHPGVLQAATGALERAGGRILSLSQTVVRGYFTLIIITRAPERATPDELGRSLLAAGKPGEFRVTVQPYVPPAAEPHAGARYILTARGVDSPNLLPRLCGCLAERGLNIEDFYFTVEGARFALVAQIVMPPGADEAAIQGDVRTLGGSLGIEVRLQHENLFRATSEVSAVRRQLMADHAPN